jgi:hypothetical protein
MLYAAFLTVFLSGCGALRSANPAYFAAGAAAAGGVEVAVDGAHATRSDSNDPWRARTVAPPRDASAIVPESAFDVIDGLTPP